MEQQRSYRGLFGNTDLAMRMSATATADMAMSKESGYAKARESGYAKARERRLAKHDHGQWLRRQLHKGTGEGKATGPSGGKRACHKG